MARLMSRTCIALSLSYLTLSAPVMHHVDSDSTYTQSLGRRQSASLLAERAEAGPVLSDFPDPSIILVGDTWWAFGTEGKGKHIQVASSTDFNTWTPFDGDALPDVGAWGVPGESPSIWAPDVLQLDDGSFLMYYSAPDAQDPTKHCTGAATSGSITGPYTPQANPLYCDLDRGGAIDASWFVDTGGQRYVLYKVDGGSIGNGGVCGNEVDPIVPTPILIQAVAGDGFTPQGDPVQILDNNGAADEGNTEAPSLVKVGDTYVLFFSSNCYNGGKYTLNYATSGALLGPYTRAAQPLASTGTNGLESPGGADIWNDGVHMLFHAGAVDARAVYTATVTINGDTVTF